MGAATADGDGDDAAQAQRSCPAVSARVPQSELRKADAKAVLEVELRRLHEEKRQAVEEEEYEAAAFLKRRIRALEARLEELEVQATVVCVEVVDHPESARAEGGEAHQLEVDSRIEREGPSGNVASVLEEGDADAAMAASDCTNQETTGEEGEARQSHVGSRTERGPPFSDAASAADEDDVDAALAGSAKLSENPAVASCAEQDGAACTGPPLDVLLFLDASFAMHAPPSLAHLPSSSWGDDEWDIFGKHVRSRGRSRLEPLGLEVLEGMAHASHGLVVGVHLCGEEESEVAFHDPLVAGQLGQQWKRALLRGSSLWGRVQDGVASFRTRGLQSVVVVTGSADEDPACCAEDCARVILQAAVPVHVISLEQPTAAQMGNVLASATGGTCSSLNFAAEDDFGALHRSLASVWDSLRQLPRKARPGPPLLRPEEEEDLRAHAARTLQRAWRSYSCRRRCSRRQKAAVVRIELVYARWRLRRCIAAAAAAASVADGSAANHAWVPRHSGVKAAMRHRIALKRSADAEASARTIQSAWRAARIRCWCKRVDRAARTLQRWCRKRWLRQGLAREAAKLQVRQLRKADTPPPAPLSVRRPPQLNDTLAEPVLSAPQRSPKNLTDVQVPRSPRRGGRQACPPPLRGVHKQQPQWVEALLSGQLAGNPATRVDTASLPMKAQVPLPPLAMPSSAETWSKGAVSSKGAIRRPYSSLSPTTLPKDGEGSLRSALPFNHRLPPRLALSAAPMSPMVAPVSARGGAGRRESMRSRS